MNKTNKNKTSSVPSFWNTSSFLNPFCDHWKKKEQQTCQRETTTFRLTSNKIVKNKY